MSQPGSVVEVLVQSRGSQLVGDHSAAATTLLVQDPTPFDDAGGQVLVDGTAYTYTTITEVVDATDSTATNGQLALSSGLVGTVLDLTPVDVWNGSQALDDLILLVATGEEGDPPIPVTLKSDQRAFWEGRMGPVDPPVAVVLSDDLTTLLDAPGWTPSINGAALVGLPDPAEVAVDPPANSPAIKTVQGNATGLTVVTEPILPTTLLDYLINGIVVESDQRTTVINLTNDGTSPLALDTDYTVTVQAHNSATDADPTTLPAASAGVSARLDLGTTPELVRAWAAFGFVLAGTLQVGNITIRPSDGDDPGGITIPLNNGGIIDLPADGSDAVITAMLRARSLTVENYLRLQGTTNYIEGGVRLANGVAAPSVKPRAGTSWDHSGASIPMLNSFGTGAYAIGLGIHRGGFWDSTATRLLHTSALSGGTVESTNLSNGNTASLFSLPSGFNPFGGVVRISSSYYVLGADANRAGRWFVYKYNTSFVKQLEWELILGGTSPQTPAMTLNGSNLMITYWTTAVTTQRIVGVTYVPDTGVQVGSSVLCDDSSIAKQGMVFAYYGTGPWGSGTYLVAGMASAVRVYTISGTTGTRASNQEWQRPNGDDMVGGAFDGTRWRIIGSTGTAWNLSLNAFTQTRSITSTKYDSVGTTHETTASPALSYSHRMGEYLRVDVDPPGYAGGADDPDSVRIYIANHQMADLGSGVTTAVYDTVSSAGSAAPTTNTFPPAVAPGYFRSDAEAGGAPYFNFLGDGSWVLGHLSGNSAGVGTQDNAFVAATSNAAPTSTTNVTIAGLSVTVTSPGTGAAWMVEISADILLSATGGNIVGLLVDAVEQTAVLVSAGATNGRFAACKRWRISGLTAGSHTFTARTRSQGAYTTTALTPSTTMTVERCA